MPLSDIVNVVITRSTQGIQEPGFGTLLILGTSKRFNERIKFYSNMDEVAVDFRPTDKEYIAAQDVFAQDITPSQIAIGRRDSNQAIIDVVTFLPNQQYTVTINGAPITLANSTPQTVNSNLTLSADLVTGNSIASTLNGTPLPAVVFDGVINTTHLATMEAWATLISTQPNIQTASVDPDDNRQILVVAQPGYNALFVPTPVITLGASQPVVTVTTANQPITPQSISVALAALINAQSVAIGVSAVANPDGTLTLNAVVPGVPYTLNVSTNINSPDRYLISVTQAYASRDYFVTINGQKSQITTPTTLQTNQQVAAQLAAAITATMAATNTPVSVTNNGDGTLTLTSDVEGAGFSVRTSDGIIQSQFGLAIQSLAPTSAVVDDLNAINTENNQWYALASIEREKATVMSIAGWVESRIKLFGTASSETEIISLASGDDTTSVAAQMNILGYTRSFVIYHQDAQSDYAECAWFGRVLPLDPGSETWKFKTLRAVPYSALSTTQSQNALSKNANTYESIGGLPITQNGTVASGEFIDIVRGIDWLTSTIQIYVFQALANNEKVPYTDSGIAIIEAQVKRALQRGIDQRFISDDPEPVVTVPKAINVPSNDKANRILRNVRFQATLTGAIHAVVINGNVTV